MNKIIFFLIISAPIISYGACTGVSPNLSADTCSYADVQSCIDRSVDGDTILIPAGDCQYPSALRVTGAKDLKFKGAGRGVTTLSHPDDDCGFNFVLGDNNHEITGITFSSIFIKMAGTGGFYVHNNEFVSANKGCTGIIIEPIANPGYEIPYGVISNNYFENGRVVITTGAYDIVGNEPDFPWMNVNVNKNWTLPTDLGGGSANVVYIEDNVFYRAYNSAGNAIDGNSASQTVFRYNTVIGNYLEQHSIQGNNRAVKRWEFYGNIIDRDNRTYWVKATRIKAGTGVFFDNQYKGNWSFAHIELTNKRSYIDDQGSAGGNCNTLLSPWDGNELPDGWPCRDQIGRGPDAVLWGAEPGNEGAYTQPLEPAYFWDNYCDATARPDCNGKITVVIEDNNLTTEHIKTGRDYIESVGCGTLANRPATCTGNDGYWATDQSCSDPSGLVGADHTDYIKGELFVCENDSWVSHFKPYLYPHPLRAGTPVSPGARYTLGSGWELKGGHLR